MIYYLMHENKQIALLEITGDNIGSIKYLLAFQNGADIWSYDYKG